MVIMNEWSQNGHYEWNQLLILSFTKFYDHLVTNKYLFSTLKGL